LEILVTRRRTATVLALVLSGAMVHGQAKQGAPAPAPKQVDEQQAKTLNLNAYAELLRSDVQAQKIAILTEVMGFSEAEDKAFWPIYRDYNAEMSKLGDERVALIQEYAQAYGNITDEVAQKLMTRAIDLDTRRRAALEKCTNQVKTALSSKMALKFLQVEHQLQLIIDLQIAALLPIVQ
jgi:hypothetical protein